MRMLNGNVLVREVQQDENKTQSGLYIPNEIKHYKIVEVFQPDSENVVKTGDKIYIPLNAGTEVKINDENFLIINVREIILVI